MYDFPFGFIFIAMAIPVSLICVNGIRIRVFCRYRGKNKKTLENCYRMPSITTTYRCYLFRNVNRSIENTKIKLNHINCHAFMSILLLQFSIFHGYSNKYDWKYSAKRQILPLTFATSCFIYVCADTIVSMLCFEPFSLEWDWVGTKI